MPVPLTTHQAPGVPCPGHQAPAAALPLQQLGVVASSLHQHCPASGKKGIKNVDAMADPCLERISFSTGYSMALFSSREVPMDIRNNDVNVRVVLHWSRLPGEVGMPRACQCAGGMGIMPSQIRFGFWLVLKRSGSGWSLKVPSNRFHHIPFCPVPSHHTQRTQL